MMVNALGRSAPLMLLLLILSVPQAVVAQSVRVEEIRATPVAFVNESVEVEGVVARFVDIGAATTESYYLEDDFGHQIQILTPRTRPSRGDRVRVRGVVALDSGGDPFIQEVETTELDSPEPEPAAAPPPPPPSPTPSPSAPPPPEPGMDPVLIGFGVGFLALVGLLAFLIVRSRSAPQPAAAVASAGPVSAPTGADSNVPPAPSADPSTGEEFDGKTVKFTAPPPGTMKLLPGRLEIIAGDDRGREVRFLKQGDGTPRITFGRNQGPAYKHIQLKAPTVSREHAAMTLAGGTWMIENRSDTNPVRVNGREIPSEGQPLDGGEEIDMGEVKFRFHAK